MVLLFVIRGSEKKLYRYMCNTAEYLTVHVCSFFENFFGKSAYLINTLPDLCFHRFRNSHIQRKIQLEASVWALEG